MKLLFLADSICKWNFCDLKITSESLFRQHVSYHSYFTKLKQIGSNVLLRNKLPECKQRASYVIPILLEGYICEWENCSIQFWTILDFFNHVATHVNCFSRLYKPTRKLCGWKGMFLVTHTFVMSCVFHRFIKSLTLSIG